MSEADQKARNQVRRIKRDGSQRSCGLCVALLFAWSCRGESPAPTPQTKTVASPTVSVAAKSQLPQNQAALRPEKTLTQCLANPDDADELLEAARSSFAVGDYSMADSCASAAAEIVPQSVEAQHLRGAALLALGYHQEAQLAFVLALALNPEDPETLAGAADFYINALPLKGGQNTRIGLEYAKRGTGRVASLGHPNDNLLGRLLLLEAQALNDLGASDLALPRIEEALALEPGLWDAQHELGLSHFNLTHFDESERAFLKVLTQKSDEPYAHHYLALIYERMGRLELATLHSSEARRLEPTKFPPPALIDVDEFKAEVAVASQELSPELALLLGQVSLQLVDVPDATDLRASSPPFSPQILGLYRGPPQSSIVLYRKNLQRATRTREELNRQIRRTLRHELGHLQGFNEVQLRRQGLE